MSHPACWRSIGGAFVVAIGSVLVPSGSASAVVTPVLVSVGLGGAAANGDSGRPAVTATGRYVAFESDASNLVAGDTNGRKDVFVRDTIAKKTTRVSVGAGGSQGNGQSQDPSISDDGRYVAFSSGASNLVAGDSNGAFDVFVHDRVAHVTTRVSVSSGGVQGNGASYFARIAPGGRFVAFVSEATNLAAGSDTNNDTDVFVRSLAAGTTERVSSTPLGNAANSGSAGPSISANGSRVAFTSWANDLGPPQTNEQHTVYVRDRTKRVTWAVPLIEEPTYHIDYGIEAATRTPAISRDGKRLAFVNLYDFGSTWGDGTYIMVVVALPSMSVLTNVTVGEFGDIQSDSTSAPRLPTKGANAAYLDYYFLNNYYDEIYVHRNTVSRTDGRTTYQCEVSGCLGPGFDLTGAGTKAVVTAADNGWIDGDTNGHLDVMIVPA